MNTVILADGFGARLAEETELRPKPVVEIGGKAIPWHNLNIYAVHGFDEFIVALGYKAEIVEEYPVNFYPVNNDISIDLYTAKTAVDLDRQRNWNVHLVDAGPQTQTGRRLKRLSRLVRRGGDLHDGLRRSRRGRRFPACLLRK